MKYKKGTRKCRHKRRIMTKKGRKTVICGKGARKKKKPQKKSYASPLYLMTDKKDKDTKTGIRHGIKKYVEISPSVRTQEIFIRNPRGGPKVVYNKVELEKLNKEPGYGYKTRSNFNRRLDKYLKEKNPKLEIVRVRNVGPEEEYHLLNRWNNPYQTAEERIWGLGGADEINELIYSPPRIGRPPRKLHKVIKKIEEKYNTELLSGG